VSLADLLNRATKGPRIGEVSARLDLADFLDDHGYDVARLLIDMADFLRDEGYTRYGDDEPGDVLLARFADLNTKAGGAQ